MRKGCDKKERTTVAYWSTEQVHVDKMRKTGAVRTGTDFKIIEALE